MNFDQSDWGVTILLVILGISILVAIIVVAKTITNEAQESKARAARLAEEEVILDEPQFPVKQKKKSKQKKSASSKKATDLASKESEAENDLVAAAEVYLTYELKDQAILSLEKHLLKNPTDKKALAMLKKAEASK